MLSNFWSDLRRGLRAVSNRPTYAAVVVLTLALGIGVNVAVYSLAEQTTLLRPLPVPEPGRLVNLNDPGSKLVGRMDPELLPRWLAETASGGRYNVFSYPMFRDLERTQEPFVGLAAHQTFDVDLSTDERAQPGRAVLVSGSYFPVLGLQPALGRLLGPQDDQVDGLAESAVLSHAYWQSNFGGDPNVLGRTLLVDDVRLTIVGVAPSGFNDTTAIGSVWNYPTVFVPITIPLVDTTDTPNAIPNHERRDSYWVHLFARLEPDVTREQASASINPLFSGILSELDAPLLFDVTEEEREAFRTRALVLEPGARGQTNSEGLMAIRIALLLLFAVSGLVLVLCCANVAGLMLVRGTERTGEMAVRASMGASRGRLASLLAAESLVLAAPAALVSLPVALLVIRGPSRVPGIPEDVADVLQVIANVTVSATATLVAIGVAVISALLAGLLPLRRLIHAEPAMTLQAYGARQTMARGVTRFRAGLATAQVAISMALLALTGAFANGVANLTRVDPGVDLDSIATFQLTQPGNVIDQAAARRLGDVVVEAIESIPGVSSVTSSYPEPLLSRQSPTLPVSAPGLEGGESLSLAYSIISPGFFRTFGISLLAGRDFDGTDDSWASASDVIVSQRFVERLGLTPADALGRTINVGLQSVEIVGVAADFRSGRSADEVEPRIYLPGVFGTRYVRSARAPEDLMNAIQTTVARVDPRLGVLNFRTMEQAVLDTIAVERFAAGAASALAVFATALAALGLYGVLAYTVAQRSREIGLRFALGAPVARVRGMVLRQVARIAVIGVVLGGIAAWALGLAAQSVLLGVEARDPLAFAVAAALLTAIMLGAAWIPARRASRVDPMTVLRYE